VVGNRMIRENITTIIIRNLRLISFLLIIVTGFIVYSNSFDCSFQFDDERFVNDLSVRNIDNFLKFKTWINDGINKRSMSLFTFALNYHLHGLKVSGYHVVNLLIHLINGVLVFLLADLIFNRPAPFNNAGSINKNILPLFTALLFIAHPIQTQAVTYITQRMTSLSAMFYMCSLYMYAMGRLRQVQKGIDKYTIMFYLAVIFSAVLALLSKQSAATIPVAILLFELFFIRDREYGIYKKYLIISFFVVAAVLLIILISGNLPRETRSISRTDYLVTQFKVIPKYIQLLIIPYNQNIDHDIDISKTFFSLKEITGLLLIISLLILGILLYNKQRNISFGIFWFFITLSVESSIIPIADVIFEHRLYLPSLGYIICLVSGIGVFLKNKKNILIIALMVMTIAYGYATYNRNKVWDSGLSLWSDSVSKSPHNPGALYSLGNYYLLQEREYETAMKYFREALRYDPEYEPALTNIGHEYLRRGLNDLAIEYYEKSLTIIPDNIPVLNNLGLLYFNKGNYDASVNYYNRSLKLRPDDVTVLNNLGSAWGAKGDYDMAIKCFTLILKIDPDHSEARKNMMISIELQGKAKK
jgi:protein O-mannosyl-transferase